MKASTRPLAACRVARRPVKEQPSPVASFAFPAHARQRRKKAARPSHQAHPVRKNREPPQKARQLPREAGYTQRLRRTGEFFTPIPRPFLRPWANSRVKTKQPETAKRTARRPSACGCGLMERAACLRRPGRKEAKRGLFLTAVGHIRQRRQPRGASCTARDPNAYGGYPNPTDMFSHSLASAKSRNVAILKAEFSADHDRVMYAAPSWTCRGLIGIGPAWGQHNMNVIPMLNSFPSYEDMRLRSQ